METFTSLIYNVLKLFFNKSGISMKSVAATIYRTLMVAVSCVVYPYSRLVSLGISRKKLPPLKNPLLEIPAIQLAHLIRIGEVKSEHVIAAYIDRCKEVNPLLNAIVEHRFEDALAEARAVDAAISAKTRTYEQMENETPLLGIPVTVKESISVRGLSNQGGRVHKVPYKAPEDAPSVAQVKRHGAIILLVSNTPELCLLWETYNKVSGRTNNPFDLKRTPGGSSGGEAALLGSGASLLGLCSDIAGSARLPAMYVGVFGHKPTPYVVSPLGHVPIATDPSWGSFFTIAPMTRYAVDLPLLLRCMADPSGPSLTLDTPVNLSSLNFFYMLGDGPNRVSRPFTIDMKAAIVRVAKHFNAREISVDKMNLAINISTSIMLRMKGIGTIYEKHIDGEPKKRMGIEVLKYLCGLSNSTITSVMIGPLQKAVLALPQTRHEKMDRVRDDLKNYFEELLGTTGVLIYPSFTTPAHYHYQIYYKIFDSSYQMIFNTLGLPVTNCMVGLDKDGLPLGVQIVANTGQDHLTLAVARELEKLYGGWVKPPSQ